MRPRADRAARRAWDTSRPWGLETRVCRSLPFDPVLARAVPRGVLGAESESPVPGLAVAAWSFGAPCPPQLHPPRSAFVSGDRAFGWLTEDTSSLARVRSRDLSPRLPAWDRAARRERARARPWMTARGALGRDPLGAATLGSALAPDVGARVVGRLRGAPRVWGAAGAGRAGRVGAGEAEADRLPRVDWARRRSREASRALDRFFAAGVMVVPVDSMRVGVRSPRPASPEPSSGAQPAVGRALVSGWNAA
jgi:hypothetical protein